MILFLSFVANLLCLLYKIALAYSISIIIIHLESSVQLNQVFYTNMIRLPIYVNTLCKSREIFSVNSRNRRAFIAYIYSFQQNKDIFIHSILAAVMVTRDN